MIAGLLARLAGGLGLRLLGAAAIAGAVAAVLLGARQAGRTAERVDGLRRTLEAARARNDVEREVDRLGDAAVRAELRRDWSRD